MFIFKNNDLHGGAPSPIAWVQIPFPKNRDIRVEIAREYAVRQTERQVELRILPSVLEGVRSTKRFCIVVGGGFGGT